MMNPELKEKFTKIIADYLGIKIRKQDFPRFVRMLSARMKSAKISSFENYYNLLMGAGGNSSQEWRRLSDAITTSEKVRD